MSRLLAEAARAWMLERIITLTGCLVLIALSHKPCLAQITTDNTLGNESSRVTPNVNIKGSPAERIDGGATRGTNLFHSFQEFNVGNGQRVYFANPSGIENIFSRVSGNNLSAILGTLGVNGSANLFLLNPKGIIFGDGATLDVGGSFLATTANAIQFGEQGFFSATDPNSPALLTINASALLFNHIKSGNIENSSTAPAGVSLSEFPLSGLRVPNGKSLLLVGGDVVIDGGGLNALGGRVELAGVEGSGTIGLNINQDNLSLSVPDDIARADVSIKNGSEVNVIADNGGSIVINAQNLEISERSFLGAGIDFGSGTPESQAGDINFNAKGELAVSASLITNSVFFDAVGNGGNLNIKANSFSVSDFSLLFVNTNGRGNAGSVSMQVNGSVSFSEGSTIFNRVSPDGIGNVGGITIKADSFTLLEGAELQTTSQGRGDGGDVTIDVRDSLVFDGLFSGDGLPSAIFTGLGPSATGKGGDIKITALSFTLSDGARLQTKSEGRGNAGNVIIQVSDRIFFDGTEKNPNPEFEHLTGIFTTIETETFRRGGDVQIETGSLTIINGAEITANTFGLGDVGNIKIKAREGISLDGVHLRGFPSGIFTVVGREVRRDEPDAIGQGQGGNIWLTAESLSLSNGAQVSAATESKGNAGNVTINTRETVVVDGLAIDGFPTGISSSVTREAEGNGGDINITTGTLKVQNGARLDSSTSGDGTAGNINITTPLLTIGENAQLSTTATETSTGERAGDITLNVSQLNIAGELGIFAETQSIADAGSLNIQPLDTPNLNINFSENGFISARTTNIGNGGSITITAPETVDIRGEGSITAETFGSGQAGNIDIESQRLTIADGVIITTSTESSGNAGQIAINATESLNLTNQSQITSEVKEGATGDSQGININTPLLTLSDNSEISAATEGKGKAGSILIEAEESVAIDSSSLLNVETNSAGEAGNIDITTNTLTIGEDAELSARNREQATGKAGNITLNANQLNISGELGIFAETEGIADAGNLTINPNNTSNLEITFIEKGQISASTSDSGKGGNITITSSDTINLTGDGSIKVEASSSGNAGNILIDSNQINISEGVEISASTTGSGNAGNINLDVNLINLNQAEINAFTNATGNAGSITLSSQDGNAENVTLINSLISTEIQSQGEANSLSNITIKTDNLVAENSTITASTSGKGNAGNITIPNVQQINLINSDIIATTKGKGDTGEINLTATEKINLANQSEISSSVETGGVGNSLSVNLSTPELELNQSQINAFTDGRGNAGSITIRANTLELINGSKIRTETDSQFDAGNITLTLSESLFISDDGGGLFANTQKRSTGNGGSIFIDPKTLLILDGATIAVDSKGTGRGGNIKIQSGSLTLDNQASISAETASNTGGDITLQIQDLLLLRRGSQISTTAGTAQAGGDGGNINIDAAFIAAVPNEDSNITANAFLGDGGTINITTQGIFGFQFQDQETFLSDITASSEFGIAGVIEINRPDLDPSQGLVEFSEETVDVAGLINQNLCVAGKGSQFIVTGSGGLPDSPKETLNVDAGWEDWRIAQKHQETSREQSRTQQMPGSSNSQPRTKKNELETIVQAQGWIVAPNGNLILTAKPVTVTPQGIWLSPLDCHMLH